VCCVHSAQVCDCESHTASPGQSRFCAHCTQVPFAAEPLQTGVAPAHAVSAGLQTQTPLRHALLSPLHSLSLRQPGWQVLFAAQYSPSAHSALRVQRTQVFDAVLQDGVVPPQWPSCVHSTQVPSPAAPTQRGALPGQTSPAPPESQTQVLLTQALASRPQSSAVRHSGV
jgi:hypothetical protein